MKMNLDDKKHAEAEQAKTWLKRVAEQQDEQAFEALFDLYAPKIKAFSLAAQPGAAMVADELVQDVMIKIWQKAHQYSAAKASPNTWIYTLARNARIDYLRKNGRYASDINPEDIYLHISDESKDLFLNAQQQQNERRIAIAMKQLPSEQAQVLAKVYMEGKTHQQIAEELQLPLGTIKSRIRLAHNKLGIIFKGQA